LFICTLYKFTFLNRSQLNFAHISPLGLEETVGYVWSEKFDIFYLFLPFSPGASAESSARNRCRRESSATAFYPWFLLVLV